jgi:hypothetical protein
MTSGLSACAWMLMDGDNGAKPCPPAQEKCTIESYGRALTQRH